MKKIDFHVHIETALPVKQSAYYFKDMCDRYGYSGVNILAFCYRLEDNKGFYEKCNEAALELKEEMGDGSYAFCCLLPGKDFARQAEYYMNNGFDGIKLLRGGKPNYYKDFPYLYDHGIYEDFFALAEEKQYPIIMHNNDPAYSWDISKAPERAIKMGWVYDDSVPTHDRYYQSVDNILERHPNLKIAMAHMGFYSENIDKAFDMMKKYPNLYMDMTPALNIYEELSLIRDRAEEFFLKHGDRVFFGTDATNHLVGEARMYNDKKNAVTSHFFSGGEYREICGKKISPVHLTDEILENLYYNNAMRFIGKEIK